MRRRDEPLDLANHGFWDTPWKVFAAIVGGVFMVGLLLMCGLAVTH